MTPPINYVGQGGEPCNEGTIFIGELKIDPFVTQICLKGKYNGDDAMIQFMSDGTVRYCLLNVPGAVWQDTRNLKLIECQPCCDGELEYFEIYRLSSTVDAIAIPHRPELLDENNQQLLPALQLVEGNKFTLSGSYDSISVAWLPDTEPNGILAVNDLAYQVKDGCNYDISIPGLGSSNKEKFNQEINFEVYDEAYVEIIVTRTYKA